MMRKPLALGAFALLALAGSANAQTYQVGQYLGNMNEANRFTYNTMGSAAQHANYGPSGANWTTLAGQNSARMAGQATATIGGRQVALTLVSRTPITAIAGAARALSIANPATAAITLLGFAAMNGWLTPAGLKWNEDPATNKDSPFTRKEEGEEVTDGAVMWFNQQTYQWTSGYSCPAGSAGGDTAATKYCLSPRPGGLPAEYQGLYFTRGIKCTDGSIVNWNNGQARPTCAALPVSKDVPVSWEQGVERLSSPTNNYADSGVDWQRIVHELLKRGASLPEPLDQTVTGPDSSPGESKTVQKKDAQGNTTTTTVTTTNNYTYNNNKVTVNTTTKTVNADGTEETETTENKDDDGAATDTALPAVPDFYEQKYKDGFGGVWTTRKAELQGTSLSTFAAKLMPTGLGAGSCPQFSINLDVGLQDFGVHDISVPCAIWQFGKFVLIISALLLARRLVFGG